MFNYYAHVPRLRIPRSSTNAIVRKDCNHLFLQGEYKVLKINYFIITHRSWCNALRSSEHHLCDREIISLDLTLTKRKMSQGSKSGDYGGSLSVVPCLLARKCVSRLFVLMKCWFSFKTSL